MLPAQLIKQKRDGKELTQEEVRGWIQGYVQNEIPDYQMSAFLMAVFHNGLNANELGALVEATIDSGKRLSWSGQQFMVDKHSTGGVGDKTSLIVGPIVASAGLGVPMMAGRGLGHTGGTVDKLEAIAGFNTQLSLNNFIKSVEDCGLAIIGQSDELCPADKKLYALRDVTATVESIPLICASIISKKVAEGIDGLVLDVKFGSGAFFKDRKQATELGRALKAVGEHFEKKVIVCLTNMNQPLGRFSGNALEIKECLDILANKSHVSEGRDFYADTRELSLVLAAWMLFLSGKWPSYEACYLIAEAQLKSGAAEKKFMEMCRAQGGDLSSLPLAKNQHRLVAEEEGFLSEFDVEALGYLNISLGAGRTRVGEPIDHAAGFEVHVKIGDRVKKGQSVLTLFANKDLGNRQKDESLFQSGKYFRISAEPLRHAEPLIADILR